VYCAWRRRYVIECIPFGFAGNCSANPRVLLFYHPSDFQQQIWHKLLVACFAVSSFAPGDDGLLQSASLDAPQQMQKVLVPFSDQTETVVARVRESATGGPVPSMIIAPAAPWRGAYVGTQPAPSRGVWRGRLRLGKTSLLSLIFFDFSDFFK